MTEPPKDFPFKAEAAMRDYRQRRQEIAERAEAATGGRWHAAYWPTPEPYYWIGVLPEDVFSSKMGAQITGPIANEADAHFIAHAREDVPWLLAENEELLVQLGGAHADLAVEEQASADLNASQLALRDRLERAEAILRKAQAPVRADGTYNYSREAFEQMANDYFEESS